MKKFYLLLLLMLVGIAPAFASWAVYIDISNTNWGNPEKIYVHLGWRDGDGNITYNVTTAASPIYEGSSVYKANLNDYGNPCMCITKTSTRGEYGANDTYGDFTYDNRSADWKVQNGSCYKLSGNNQGASVTTNYSEPNYYQIHGDFITNGSWKSTTMTQSGNVWSLSNVQVRSGGANFGIKKMKGEKQEAWINADGTSSVSQTGGTYATKDNGSNFSIPAGTYDFSFNPSTNKLTVTPVSTNTVATPVIGNGAWDGDSYKVNITCATEGATIQYSTDGNNWTTGSTFTASTNEFTLYAKATKSGMDASEQTDKTIKVFSAGPTIGSFNGATVTITGAPDGATLYYNDDNTDIWIEYEGPITLPATGDYTLKAHYSRGGINSPEATKTETLQPLYTAFFDATGTTNFSSTANAYVYKSRSNNAWPGAGMSKVSGNLWKYEQRLDFIPDYIIFNNGNGTQYPSETGFAFTNGSTYGMYGLMSNVATPVISDENAELNGVTITCATDGAQIYYTFGNADFSKTAWKAYTPGSTISTPGSAYTLRAIAVATDDEESAIATKTAYERYTIFYEDSDNWNPVYAYVYNGSSNTGAWPGPAMTQVDQSNLWKITFRTNINPKNVIFNNNNGSKHPAGNDNTPGFAFQNGATYTASGIKPKPVELWLLGTMNNWTPSNDWKFVATTETESESGAYNLILKNVAISNVSWFKIADVTFNASTGTYDWDNINDFGNSDNFEGQCMDYNQTYTLTKKNDGDSPTNCSIKDDFTGDIKFNSTTGAIKFVYVDKGVSATLSIRHIPSYDAERGKPASKILFRIDPKDFRYTEDASGKKIWDITNIKVVVKRDLYKDFNGSVNTEIVTVKHDGIEETVNLATGLNEYEGDFYIYEFDKEDGEITPDGAEYNFYINAEITGYNSKNELVTINAMAIGGNVVPFEGLTSENHYPDELTIVDNPIVFDTKFDIPVDGGIRYVRTMKATDLDKYPGTHSWQPWFMPFDVTKKEAAEFITTYTDGKLEILTLDRIEGTGDNLTAYFTVVDNNAIGDDDVIMSHNTPYIFLPKETGAHDLKFATGENETRVIHATKVGDEYVDGLEPNATGWQMVGNYVQIRMGGTGEGENAGETNSYALSNGTFSKGLSSRVSYLNPFRVRLKYFGSSNPVNTKIRIARTTGATSTDEEMVNDLLEDMTSGEAVIYDMQGRRVNNPGRGMFIINGHKVVIK